MEKIEKHILYLCMSHKKHHFRTIAIAILVIASFSVGILTGFFIFTAPKQPVAIITPPPQITLPPPKETSFIVVGDIMLSRNVARHAEKSGRAGWIWENISSFLRSSDFAIGNLE